MQSTQWKTNPTDIALVCEGQSYTVAALREAASRLKNRHLQPIDPVVSGRFPQLFEPLADIDNQFLLNVRAIDSITPGLTPQQVMAIDNLPQSSAVFEQAFAMQCQQQNQNKLKEKRTWTVLVAGTTFVSASTLLALCFKFMD